MKFIVYTCCLLFVFNTSHSQSKKEQILILKNSIDSLKTINNNLALKNENLINNEALLSNLVVVKEDSIILLNSIIKILENKNKDLKNNVLSLQNRIGYSDWFLNNFNLKLNNIFFERANINPSLFPTNLPDEVKIILNDSRYLGDWQKDDLLEIKSNSIKLEIENIHELNKTLIITNGKIIISYHVSMGSEGNTYVYDLSTNKGIELNDMYVTDVSNENEFMVNKDYYNNERHVFETGIYNFKTKKYKLINID